MTKIVDSGGGRGGELWWPEKNNIICRTLGSGPNRAPRRADICRDPVL
jgi:hypothetical protein